MRTIHRDIVAALIFSKDGKLWQGFRDPARGGVWPDCWNIPGGGVEDGESKEDAIRREVLEETSIDISRYPIEMIDDEGTGVAEKTLKDSGERVLVDMDFTVYRVQLDRNSDDIPFTPNDEFVEGRWSTLDEAKQLKLTPPTVALFQRLEHL